jgi:hypothetical protein
MGRQESRRGGGGGKAEVVLDIDKFLIIVRVHRRLSMVEGRSRGSTLSRCGWDNGTMWVDVDPGRFRGTWGFQGGRSRGSSSDVVGIIEPRGPMWF